MKPFDPRLLRHARTTRRYLIATTVLGLASTALIIAQASLLASAITRVVLNGAGLAELDHTILALAAVILGRAGVTWLQETAAHRASAGVKSELRGELLAHLVKLGPGWLHGERTGAMTALVTRGLDALDSYFARYLPQLLLAALLPAAVLAWIFPADIVAAVTIVITLPLIPIFMALIGLTTEKLNQRQFRLLTRLSQHLLEIIAGLPTLKVFGQAKAQATAIRALTAAQRRHTMRTLRLAFLSSLALELLATLSVALVAVGIGLRVVNGSLDLRTALVILILAPEVYLPLRQLGTHYHASAEGIAAATEVFAVLETPPPVTGQRTDLPDPRRAPLIVDAVSVTYPDRGAPALAGLSLRVEPGEIVALTGPSGCGKSTLVNVVLGFTQPTGGRVVLGEGPHAVDLADADPGTWRSQIAYVPQRPYLFHGTVADNIRLDGGSQVDDATVRASARLAQLDDLPHGLSTMVNDGGGGLSAGQRQRVALARAFMRDAPLVILDEPTANLDGLTELEVVDAIRQLARDRTVLIVAHRPALVTLADRVVSVSAPPAMPAHRTLPILSVVTA